jgi:hypothetical protein
VGRQVAVLRLHAALFWLRNDYTLLAERGERNAQLQYLLHFSLRTSENAVKAKFVHIAHSPELDCPGPLHTWRYTVCVVGKGVRVTHHPQHALGAGAGALTRGPLAGWATLAAKILGSGNLVGPYPGLCITIDRGHMLCPADRGHRRLSAPSRSLGRTLFEILYMDFQEFTFHDVHE